MNFPKYKAGPVEYWLAEAVTQFINGALAGFKIGATVGVSSGGGVAATDLGTRVSPLMNALIAVGENNDDAITRLRAQLEGAS